MAAGVSEAGPRSLISSTKRVGQHEKGTKGGGGSLFIEHLGQCPDEARDAHWRALIAAEVPAQANATLMCCL